MVNTDGPAWGGSMSDLDAVIVSNCDGIRQNVARSDAKRAGDGRKSKSEISRRLWHRYKVCASFV